MSKIKTRTNDQLPAVENPLAHLLQIGRDKGYVTLDDIAVIYPKAENNVDQLEEAFSALLTADIPYVESEEEIEELLEEVEEEDDLDELEDHSGDLFDEIDPLENISTNDTVGLYIKQAGKVPLLTRDEEQKLTSLIDEGRRAQNRLAEEELTLEERENLSVIVNEGWEAFEHLIQANSRLVISIAKKYVGRGVSFLDLIQEGNIGMMRAALKFERARGYKFSTYATWWIRQSISRSIADQARTIRIPVHVFESINRLLRAQRKLVQQLGRDPNSDELAVEAGFLDPKDAQVIIRARSEGTQVPLDVRRRWIRAAKKVSNIMRASEEPMSLESPIGTEDSSQLGDFIQDQDALEPMDAAAREMLREQVKNALAVLSDREREVLEMRFGLIDGKDHTLEEVGQHFKVTRERVRQIEAKALRKLRHPTRSRHLRDYFG